MSQATTEPQGTGTTTETQGAGATGAQTTTEPQGTQPQGASQETLEAKAARLERELSDARREAAKDRVNAKATAAQEASEKTKNDLVASILGTLGLTPDGKKVPTVDDLTGALTTVQAENRTLKLKETVREVAPTTGADPSKLFLHTGFLSAVAALEPGDTAGVKKAVEDALKEYPYLAAGQASAGKSGTDMSGGSGEGAKSITEQISILEAAGKYDEARRLKGRMLLQM